MQIKFLGGATTVTGSQFLLDDRPRPGPHRLRHVPGQPERVDPQPDPVRLRPGRARRRPAHARPPRPLRAAAAPGQGRLPRSDPRHGRHDRAGRRSSCSTRASSTRSSPSARRAGRSAIPTRSRRTIARRADQYEAALELAARRRRRGSPATRRRRARRDDRRASAPPTWPTRPRGRAPGAAAAPRDRPRRAALHRQGRRARARASSSRSTTATEIEVAPGIHATFVDAGHILGLGDHPAARSASDEGGDGADHRLLGRPRPARDADPARPDADDRRRLRPRRVDLRRPRARARGRGDPRPRRDRPDGRRRGRRAAGPVVRHRADPGGRLGARSADRARRDPAAAALPRFAHGVEGVRHLPPPPRVLRRGDRQAPARGRHPARLPEPDHHQRREGSRRRSPGRRGRT